MWSPRLILLLLKTLLLCGLNLLLRWFLFLEYKFRVINPEITTDQILLVWWAIVIPLVVDLKLTDIIRNTSPGQDYYGSAQRQTFGRLGKILLLLLSEPKQT